MSLARWLLPLLTLAMAGVIVFWEADQRTSPGPLHPAHAARAELLGANGCRRCHGAGEGRVSAAACGTCHGAVQAQLDSGRGVHGSLAPGEAGGCEHCHAEHHGAQTRLLDDRSFARAGIADIAAYDHAHVPGFALEGAHRGLACRACHAQAEAEVAPPARYLGLSQACASCHEDPHRGAFGAACADCHGQARPFGEAPGFRHEALALHGRHAAVACVTCHPEGTPRDVARQRLEPQPTRACADCHEHPHAPALVAAAVAGVGPAGGCAGCHTDAHATFAEGSIDAAQHAATGFPLVAPHAGRACAECHAGATRRERFPGRSPQDCRACHRDEHRGQFDHDTRYVQCTACHDGARFSPHHFDVAAHAATAFPLTGAHAAVGCAMCHATPQAGGRQFHGTTQVCADCHRDVHAGAFERPGLPQEVEGRSGCARCHGTEAFAPVPPRSFDHGAWTGHALAGVHARLECARCHARGDAPAADGRRLAPAAGRNCVDCHADPHLGQFRRGKRDDCAACHDESSFLSLRFDHDRDSAFALDKTHAALACSACHLPAAFGAQTAVRYRPLGTRCGDCHVLEGGKVRR